MVDEAGLKQEETSDAMKYNSIYLLINNIVPYYSRSMNKQCDKS